MDKPTTPNRPAAAMAEAKRRFRLLLKIMAGITFFTLVAAFAWLASTDTPLTLHLAAAVTLAVIGSMAMAAVLMGLIFFSHASGTDADSWHPGD